MTKPWTRFFDAHAPHYDENPFTQHTVAEVDFFLSLYALSAGQKILDMGCGTGRHSIELAQRGFQVTGVDISPGMLQVARAKALLLGLNISWVVADASDFESSERFDAAICLCEGGPGLLEAGEDAEVKDISIFKSIAKAVKPNGGFLLTVLNGYSIIRQMKDEHIAEGRFDPSTMRAQYQDQWDLPEGTQLMNIYERLFIPPEMKKILGGSGFEVDNVFGGTAGHWARRPLSLDEVEAMYVCRRK